jgi:hypothetical protein
MNNMDNQKSMDLGAVKEQIAQHNEGLGQIRSMEYAKTCNNNLEDTVGDRIVVALKAWPAQSIKGILPESYTVIRGQQYMLS